VGSARLYVDVSMKGINMRGNLWLATENYTCLEFSRRNLLVNEQLNDRRDWGVPSRWILETGSGDGRWMELAQARAQWRL
jgi:hypothetical protein